MKIKSIPIHSLLLIGILILAAVLRCHHLIQIPFTNDELSAIYRLQFNSLSELLNQGIAIDGHPALVQLFLYYYCKLFGYQEWIVKLPFILSGLISIWLVYKIAALAVNRNLGLLVATFMSTTQYYVMYSQLARPYSPGVLFTLLFLYSGLSIIQGHKRKHINYLLFSIALTLCAITHYFSFLASLLLLGCFIFEEKKEGRKKIMLASMLALGNPVMQYSVLIFSSSLFLFFIFYGISKMRLRIVYVIILLMISVNVYGLIVKRQHYQLFYHQGYQAAAQSISKYPSIKLFANGNSPLYFQYYFTKYKLTPLVQTTRYDSLTYFQFKELLVNTTDDTIAIICGMASDPEYFTIAKEYFPEIVKEEYGASFEAIVLARNNKSISPISNPPFHDLKKSFEYDDETDLNITSLTLGANLIVSTTINFTSDSLANPLLVVIVEDVEHHQVFWKASNAKDFKIPGQKKVTLSLTIRLKEATNCKYPLIKTFIWNKDKQVFSATTPSIYISEANKVLYGIINDF